MTVLDFEHNVSVMNVMIGESESVFRGTLRYGSRSITGDWQRAKLLVV